MTMVKILACFYNVINLSCFAMKLAAMICKLDRFLENWQIVQCNLQIGQISRLVGTYTCVGTFFLHFFGIVGIAMA